ncbi:hypothetical protein ACX27_27295 [Nostoc piscinale CENA21]|uniref:Transcription regulator PadR N-terminal domain-containing protein n=1 Tax=Nostoc piscinale CENA21 TaxID=224013 RepID=A0A0M3V6M8_9NOSO|nr:PadR family transcriptional regulator [Nostoc piscinale]ALF55717.1 hypothetical protein ACX27_27295 [Nostoc piscinale CENA21]
MSGIALSALEEEVLIYISGKRVYGLQVIDAIASLSEGKRPGVAGTYYPIFSRLEERGLLKSAWGDSDIAARRKYYEITKQGIEALQEKDAYRRRLASECSEA